MPNKQQNAFTSAGPSSRQLYKQLLTAIRPIGKFREEIKKTSVHLLRGSAFAGVRPRKQYLLLTIKATAPIKNPRIVKEEQVSKNRWHLEVKLSSENEIDRELLTWLREAYDLCQ
jgi:Domain of unknown function (DUF5655)